METNQTDVRDVTLLTKVRRDKAVVFPGVMYGYERWTIKKAKRPRIDALKLWCCRRLLRVPQTARRSNLKEINLDYSLEGLMVKLKLQYFGHLRGTTNSLKKTLMLGNIEGKENRMVENEVVRQHGNSMDMNVSKLWEAVKDRRAQHAAVLGVAELDKT